MSTALIQKTLSIKDANRLYREGKYEEALILIEQLLARCPEFSLYQQKRHECLEQIARSHTTNGVNSRSQTHPITEKFASKGIVEPVGKTLEDALGMAANGKFDAARHLLKALVASASADVTLLLALARVEMSSDRFADALNTAKLAIAKYPTNRDAYKIAEQASIELGMYDEANRYFLDQPSYKISPELRSRGKNLTLDVGFKLPPIIGAANDYRHILERAAAFTSSGMPYTKRVSIIVPVYNRSQILANTLAALTHQTYPKSLIEVIVVDDGSADDVLSVIRRYENTLSLYLCRQADYGYRVAAARNIGLRQAKGDSIVFMDADILPMPGDIEAYMRVLHVSDECLLIGHRRYVDVSGIDDIAIRQDIRTVSALPNINPNNDVADRRNAEGISIDWRYPVYEQTNYLIDDLWPFTKAAGGNIAFSRRLFEKAGFVDEDFVGWGCEDDEHGYRLFNSGAYFIPMMAIVSLHQEPLADAKPVAQGEECFRTKGHAITRKLFGRKCPAPTVRKYVQGELFDVPKVSIYIPAYNAERYIRDAVESCLNQSFDDLEVCICNDGSTDRTLEILQQNFGQNPKVRWISQENGGIGKATNTAIGLCRGMYIGQLDADDLLKREAVRRCVEILDHNNVDGVYTDCDYIDPSGRYIRDGWCGGDFSREWMTTGMIATHFRMFRKRLWSRTTGCNEKIKNAVDLDLWLKLNERGNIRHIHEVLYSYRWHGSNTSIRHRKDQEINHLKVVSDSLTRQGLDRFWRVQSAGDKLNPRAFKIAPATEATPVRPEDVVFLIPTCARYAEKTDAVRRTWARELAGFGYRHFFLMGNPDLPHPAISGDVLYVPCKDDYESLLFKLVLGYQFLYRTMNFTHVYKIDDDCYPDLEKITSAILPQLSQVQYAAGQTHPKGARMNDKWHFGKCSDKRFDKPYRFDVTPFEFAKGGYGYFLRSDVLPVLFEKVDLLRNELTDFIYSFEDVRIAELLQAHGVSVLKLEGYDVRHGDSGETLDVVLIYDITSLKKFEQIHASRTNRTQLLAADKDPV